MENRRTVEIKQVQDRVLELLQRMDLPPRTAPAVATWEACERDALANSQNLNALRVAFRQRVLVALENEWVVIARILENLKPQTLARLSQIRETILQHTDPAKTSECWLESAGNTFGPNQKLQETIQKLADEVQFVSESLEQDDLTSLQKEAPTGLKTLMWLWNAREHPALLFLGFIVVIGPLLWLLYGLLSREEKPTVGEQQIRYLSPDPNTHTTDLYPRTKAKIDQQRDYLLREKVDPWLFMGSKEMTITLHDGSRYGYYGLEYGGSVAMFFWKQLIDPFLEEAIQKLLDDVGKECRANNVDAAAPLNEAAWLLKSMVHHVYSRMAEVDQRLRAKRDRKDVPRRNVEYETVRMEKVVDEQLKAAKTLYCH